MQKVNHLRKTLVLFLVDFIIVTFVIINVLSTSQAQSSTKATSATTTTSLRNTTTADIDGIFEYFIKTCLTITYIHKSNLLECIIVTSNNPNTTCPACLKNDKCFYCNTDNSCKKLKFDGIFPSGCKASDARWFSCGC